MTLKFYITFDNYQYFKYISIDFESDMLNASFLVPIND